MIGRLQGAVFEPAGDGSCIVDVNGVGYEVFVPARSAQKLPAPPSVATLHIHTHVREESLTLYGFATREDRAAFRALLGVSGVGPKLALSILNELTAAELAMAVAREDKNRFKGISGVGKKMAERLVIDLRDRLPTATAVSQVGAPTAAQPTSPSDTIYVAINALVQMGFSRAEAERAVAVVNQKNTELTVEEMLREALSALA